MYGALLCIALDNMTVPNNNQKDEARLLLASGKFPLLRRLSITSLAAMLITATLLIFLYRQDQFAEHEVIAVQDNEESAIHLQRLLDEQFNTLVTSGNGLDAQVLKANPNIDLFTAELKKVRPPGILKVKVYNLSGTAIYSSVKSEIGGIGKHPEWIGKALQGKATGRMEFRASFNEAAGEKHDVYVSEIYMPLTHAGNTIGILEIYSDATPIFKRIRVNTIRIALIAFSVFAALYAALFFSVLRADRAVAEWQRITAESNEKIHKMAFYDALTQLPNRHLLDDRLAQTMAASKRSGLYGALMFLDMDNFKPLNDMHGHGAGDLLLVEAARRISGCVREADTVARFGGDEFVVVLSELDADKAESTMEAGLVAEKIRAVLGEPYGLKIRREGKAETAIEHHCTSSIGVVLFIDHEASTEDILKWADMAMYQSKEAGRNLIRFYDLKA